MCVLGVVYVDVECLEVWVLRASRKLVDCEICFERMMNVLMCVEL